MRRAARSLAAVVLMLAAMPPAVGAATRATGWSVAQLAPPSPGAYDLGLTGVSCAAADDCWAVGSEGISRNSSHSVLAHWNGSAWTFVSSPAGRQRDVPVELLGIACPSSTSCWAVGWVFEHASTGLPPGALIERWDGRSWTVVPVPSSLGDLAVLRAVDCPDPNLCFAVGEVRQVMARGMVADAPLVLRWNADRWTVDPSQDPSVCPGGPVCGTQLSGVACGEPGERHDADAAPACLAVGHIATTSQDTTVDQALVEELAGGAWRRANVPTPPGAAHEGLTGVSCVRGARPPETAATPPIATATPKERCVAVGTYDHRAQYGFNGRRVSPWTSPYALAFDDGRWSLMTVPVGENEPTVQIHGLVCQPSLLPSAPPGARLAGAPECLAVGDSSLVETLPIPRAWATDGSTWSDLDTGLLGRSVNSLSAVTCVARTACVATGWTVYERATTTAAAFTVPPASVVRVSASDRRQAVVATYAAPSPPTVTPGGTSSAWPRILVVVPGVGLVLVAVLAWRRRARQRDT